MACAPVFLNHPGHGAGHKAQQQGRGQRNKPFAAEKFEAEIPGQLAKAEPGEKRRKAVDQNQGEKDDGEPAQHGVV